MPNIKSAKKRVLVNEAKRQINRAVTSEVKSAIKKFNAAIDSNNIDEAEKLLPSTISIIDSACTKGTLHKNNAARKKAAISARLDAVKSGKITIEIKKDNKTIAAQKALVAKEARDALKAENQRKAAERVAAKEAEDSEKGKKAKADKKDAPKKAVKETKAKSEAKEAAPAKESKAKKTTKAKSDASEELKETAPAKESKTKKTAKAKTEN